MIVIHRWRALQVVINKCTGEGWGEDQDKPLKKNERMIISTSTKVGIYMEALKKVFKCEWTIYYLIKNWGNFYKKYKILGGFHKIKDQILVSMTLYIFRVTSPSSGVQMYTE